MRNRLLGSGLLLFWLCVGAAFAETIALPYPVVYMDDDGTHPCSLLLEFTVEPIEPAAVVVPPFDLSDPVGVAGAGVTAWMANDLNAYKSVAHKVGDASLDFFLWREVYFQNWSEVQSPPFIDMAALLRGTRIYRIRISDPALTELIMLPVDVSVAPPKNMIIPLKHEAIQGVDNAMYEYSNGNPMFTEVQDRSRQHTIVLSDSLGPPPLGHEGETLKLHFDGAVPGWGALVFDEMVYVIDTDPVPPDEPYVDLIQFYRDTLMIFSRIPEEDDFYTSSEMAAFKSRLTNWSAENLEGLIGDSPAALYRSKSSFVEHLKIIFILDADPFFLVLRSKEQRPNYSDVAVDLLIRQGGTFRFASWNCWDSLKRLLKVDEFRTKLLALILQLEQNPG